MKITIEVDDEKVFSMVERIFDKLRIETRPILVPTDERSDFNKGNVPEEITVLPNGRAMYRRKLQSFQMVSPYAWTKQVNQPNSRIDVQSVTKLVGTAVRIERPCEMEHTIGFYAQVNPKKNDRSCQ